MKPRIRVLYIIKLLDENLFISVDDKNNFIWTRKLEDAKLFLKNEVKILTDVLAFKFKSIPIRIMLD